MCKTESERAILEKNLKMLDGKIKEEIEAIKFKIKTFKKSDKNRKLDFKFIEKSIQIIEKELEKKV